MLIQALCDYYQVLSAAGKVLPEGYSKVKIHYLIALTPEGTVDSIVNCQKKTLGNAGKKEKEIWAPLELTMPQRTEKSGIDPNIAEHRPLYIFGLNLENDGFTPEDRTEKAKKSHKAFVEANLAFTEGMRDPVVLAYRAFLEKWKPEAETENENLKKLGKEYGKSGYAFCLTGKPDQLLHDSPEFREKWEAVYRAHSQEGDTLISQCAITGEPRPIARIHGKIKGVAGGLPTGSVLIGFNNPSENSYGNDQSYNSNVSQEAMRAYTEALNYLLSDKDHRFVMDDLTILFWATDGQKSREELFMQMLLGRSEEKNAEQTEAMIKDLLEDLRKGNLREERLKLTGLLREDVDFYMVGLKPNSSRLSVKFVIRKKYAEVLWNMAKFQRDMQVTKELRPVFLYRIREEMISPKSKNEKVNPALMSRVLESILYGRPLPVFLLDTMVRRVKTDSVDVGRSIVRTGVIKACVNQMEEKEELKVALDKENKNQAYLCGRLFAVLERLQREAAGTSLNRTIKDTYFASACSSPALVFPKLIQLAQYHLNKLKNPDSYNKTMEQMGEIIQSLEGEFPDQLSLKDQGRFIVGYFQQNPKPYKKNQEEK